MVTMAARTATAARSDESVDSLQPFLRYQAPRLVSTTIHTSAGADGSGLDDDELSAVMSSPNQKSGSQVAARAKAATARTDKASPIPVARLAAAKDAAREAFLAANSTRPNQAAHTSVASTTSATASEAVATRKDPAHRLPTPPSSAGKTGGRGTRLAVTMGGGNALKRSGVDTTTKAPSAEDVLQSMMANARGAAPLLNAMFPPVPLDSSEACATVATSPSSSPSTSGGSQWVRYVSTEPATRDSVALLHAQLRQRLPERRARATGLCPVRREIYEDVFDELLRQVTLEEPARGVLLQRLRDDLHDSLRVHQDLCNRSHHLCAKRCVEAHDDEAFVAMEARVKTLECERNELRAAQHALMVRRAAIEAGFDKARAARNKKQQEELAYLRRANQQLSLRLKLETERVTAGVNDTSANHPNASATAAE